MCAVHTTLSAIELTKVLDCFILIMYISMLHVLLYCQGARLLLAISLQKPLQPGGSSLRTCGRRRARGFPLGTGPCSLGRRRLRLAPRFSTPLGSLVCMSLYILIVKLKISELGTRKDCHPHPHLRDSPPVPIRSTR